MFFFLNDNIIGDIINIFKALYVMYIIIFFLKKIQKQNEILLFQQEEGRQPTITSTKYVDGNFDFLVCLFFIV